MILRLAEQELTTDVGAGTTDVGAGTTDEGAGTTTGEAIPTDDTTAGGAGPFAGEVKPTNDTTAGGAGTTDVGAGTTDEGAGTTDVGAGTTDVGGGTTDVGGGTTTGEAIPTDDTTAGGAGTSTGGAGTATNSSANDLNTGVNSSGTGSSVSGLPPGSAGALGGANLGVSNQSSTSRTHTEVTGDNSLPTTSSSESATSSSAENPNSVQEPISGDGQTVVLGDVSENHGTSAKISTDKKSYAPGDSAVITVQDPDADVDPSVINTVTIVLGSSIDDPNGSTITLTETREDSGIFVGTTTVPTAGNNFKINYDASRPQAQAVISGVDGGSVEVSELPVSSFEQVLVINGIGNGQPAVVIGNGIQVAFLDGADLALSSDCEELGFNESMDCGGSTQITISYANSPPDLNELPPGSLTIWQFVPLVGWLNLADYHGNIQRDPNTRTVTATSPFGPGVYVIGSPESGPGGGGGGAGFPGAGIVPEI